MDSPLPGRVYDPRTAAEGGTNADDVTDVLQDLPVAIRKENTSAAWHREEQVVGENPDLIISHLSCLLDARVGGDQTAISGASLRRGGKPPSRVPRVCGGAQPADAVHHLFTFAVPGDGRRTAVGGHPGGTSAGPAEPPPRLHRSGKQQRLVSRTRHGPAPACPCDRGHWRDRAMIP